jgi:hypothetical protein
MEVNVTVVKKLVDRLGGPGAVARACGSVISGDAVTAWTARNKIPWRWRTRVKKLADERGLKLSAAEEKAISLYFGDLI